MKTSFNFMTNDFKIKNIGMLLLYWYIFMLGARFLLLDYTWSPTLLILPAWIYLMAILFYNGYKKRIYIQTKYNDGEYMFGLKHIEVWKKSKEDELVVRYTQNMKKFMLLGLGIMISIPFVTVLTTINWSLK